MAEEVLIRINLDVGDAKQEQASLNAEIVQNREERSKLTKELKKLVTAEEKNEQAIKKVSEELVDNKNKAKQLRDEEKLLGKIIDSNGNSLDAMRAKLAKLTAARNGAEVGTKEFKALQKEIKGTSDEIKKIEEAGGDFRRSVGNYAQAGGQLGGVFGNIGASISAAFGPLGLIAATIGGIAALVDFQQELEKTRRQVQSLTGATGQELNNLTAGITAVADTFDQDFNEVLIAANSTAQAFGISTEEALDKIQTGFLNGANANGELLAQMTEYPRILEEAGVSADQTFQIIEQTAKQGIYSDKGIDTIKEANLRLREMTPATQDALNSIGLSADEIQKSLEDGSKTTFDVIQEVSGELDKLPETSAKVGTAIADIFGGPGEDAGLQYIKSLKDINGEQATMAEIIENAEGKFTDLQVAQALNTKASEDWNLLMNDLLEGADGGLDSITSQLQIGVVEGFRAAANGVISLINWFIELQNESTGFRLIILAVKTNFNLMIESALFGIRTLVTSVSTLGEIIKAAFTGNFSDIPDIIAEGFTEVKDDFVETGKGVGEDLADGIKEALNPSEIIEPLEAFGSEAEAAGEELGEKVGAGVAKGVERSREEILNARKATIEAELLSVEEGSERELELRRRQLETERDIALNANNLLAEEKLLIQAQFQADSTALEVEFMAEEKERRMQDIAEELEADRMKYAEKNLLLQEQFLNQEITEQEFNERINEMRLEQLDEERQLFEEGSAERLEADKAFQDEQFKQFQENEKRKQDSEAETKKLREDLAKQEIGIAKDVTGALKKAAGENEGVAKAAQITEKGIAATEVGINLQKELSAIAANSAANPANAVTAGAAGAAQFSTQSAIASIRAGIAVASILAFDDGGNLALSGGHIPQGGGMIKGLPHGAGGVKFAMGGAGMIGEADGRQGEAYIVNTGNDPSLKALASQLNVAGGGKSFDHGGVVTTFQDGGAVSPDVTVANQGAELIEALSALPAPVVSVEDIIGEVSNKAEVEDGANF